MDNEAFPLLTVRNYLTKFAYPKLACVSGDLEQLGAKPYQYVRLVSAHGNTHCLQIVDEKTCDDPRNLPSFKRGIALLSPRARTILSVTEGEPIRLEAIRHLTLKVEPGRVDQSSGEIVDVESPSNSITRSQQLMLIHPQTGSRLRVAARLSKSSNSAIHLPKRLRNLLGIGLRSTLYATPCYPHLSEGARTRKFLRFLCDVCVGQSAIHLRLCHAQPSDDGMGIGRVSEEVFDVLGIERSDRVILSGASGRATCRLLPHATEIIEQDIELSEHDIDKPQLELWLDAAIRAQMESQVGDVLEVQRDTQYLIAKRARDLLLPLIGTTFTVNQIFQAARYRFIASLIFSPVVLVISLAKERSLVKKIVPRSSFDNSNSNDP